MRLSDNCQPVLRILSALVLSLWFAHGQAIPIMAYGGVKADQCTKERLLEFRHAGFDVSITNFSDASTADFLEVLNLARQCHVQFFALSTELWADPVKTIHAIKHHPALFGYYIFDEPLPQQMEDMRKRYTLMRTADSSRPFYLNLIPYYDDGLLHRFGIDHYEEYVRQASSLGVPQLCFDYYPITDSGIRPKWYLNLETIRREALRTNRPFWGFALSTPHADYPQPTLAMLRLQMYTNLAYGAKALLYFTYWTPPRDQNFVFHDGPIGLDGHRTKTYDIVREMNLELRPMLPLFDKAQVTHVAHMGKNIPEGANHLTRTPTNIKRIKTYGQQGALISLLTTKEHEYMAVVNKDYQKELKIHIEATKTVVQIDKHLQDKAIRSDYTITGGDMLLFRLK